MSNEIIAIGLSSGQPYGYVTSQSATLARGLDNAKEVNVTPEGGRASGLPTDYSFKVGVKEDLTFTALSIRQANGALDQASTLMQKVSNAVDQVKNYPPYPPGNNDRVKYISSLNGLRKEIEALTFPPVAKTDQPVFYPRIDRIPVLDTVKATDEDVARFRQSVSSALEGLDAAYAGLHAQADTISDRINADLPPPPANEQSAGQAANEVAVGLSHMSRGVASDSSMLNRLTG